MPVNTWNFYRAVSVGSDHKSWLEQNPQVEDGRIGGNQPFDQEVTDQYQYEVNHMMRRLRLNFYRAEDAFLVMRKRQWAEEDREFKKKQKERKRKAKNKRIEQNKQRRLRKEMERRSMSLPSLVLEDINNEAYPDFRAKNLDILKSHFICPNCKTLMNANMKIFQCIDGHIVCENCKSKTEVCTCSLYQFFKKIFLRNVLNVV